MNAKPLVLLAEDYPPVRRIVLHVLTRAGYEVVQAHDGNQAVELAVERVPDLLILDINLPGLNGIEALKQMRQHGPLAATPALMLTGMTQQEYVAEAAQAGAIDYFLKGEFNVQHFLAVVQGTLAEVVQTPPAETSNQLPAAPPASH